ncbi:MAG TPA: class I SAM-dependent methyltransferase [Planctomycetes bacterium]|nr:class I SAM-dependent methyltransferase [Planctomycetota bacterium]
MSCQRNVENSTGDPKVFPSVYNKNIRESYCEDKSEGKNKKTDLQAESEHLRKAWARHNEQFLDGYLVRDVEDPRINVQSIITRGFLLDTIFPSEFNALIREEIRFGACLSSILRLLESNSFKLSRSALLSSLQSRRKTCHGVYIPSHVQQCFDLISGQSAVVPDYVTEALIGTVSDESFWIAQSSLSTFEIIWAGLLSNRKRNKISVLEPACGSANDYRYLNSFGVSAFLKYTGFDICQKNIANALHRLPNVDFRTANVLEMPFEANSYDYLFVHDLFEHLSPIALEAALAEICRVTRKQALLSFFNMRDIDRHLVQPCRLYHWNMLSLKRIRKSLTKQGCLADVVHIDSFLRDSYACDDHPNKEAYTIIVTIGKN